jgi:hypothetical protein
MGNVGTALLTLLEVVGAVGPLLVVVAVLTWALHLLSSFAAKEDTAAKVSISYVAVSCMLGLVVGMLVNLLGGFRILVNGDATVGVVGAIASVLAIVIGVVGSLFLDSDKISLRNPVGAIGFLTMLVTSGLYWLFLSANMSGGGST